MGEEKGEPFDINRFVETHDFETESTDDPTGFFDGVSKKYGRFYEDRYKRRSGRKQLDKDSQQDPCFRPKY